MYYKNQDSKELPAHRISRKHFRIFSRLFGISIGLSILFFLISNDLELFGKMTSIIGFGAGIWLMVDNELLAIRSFFFKCALVALLFSIYALTMEYSLNIFPDVFLRVGSFCMLALLVIQWPTRIGYLIAFKREPKTDRRGKFADLIYSLILFGALVPLPLLISDYLL